MKNYKSIRKFVYLASLAFALLGTNAFADSHEPPPPPGALEGFFCSYNDGKDRGDLDAARDFYLKQAAKAGLDVPDTFLWTANKGQVGVDIAWFNVYENMVAFGEADDAGLGSAEMAAAQARFDSVGSCNTVLGVVTPVYQGETEPAFDGRTSVATYACKLQPGASFAALGDLRDHIAAFNAGMGDDALSAVFQVVPQIGDLSTPDVVMFAVSEGTAAYTRHLRALATTAAGQAVARHFTAILDCGVNLWRVEQYVGGE